MILYEDAQLVVCCKPRGVLSAADSSGQESMARCCRRARSSRCTVSTPTVPGVIDLCQDPRGGGLSLGAPHGRQGISRTGRGRAVQRAGGTL